MQDLKEKKEIQIGEKTYIISKFPPVKGRAIMMQYPTSAAPKIGNYEKNEEMMLELMNYVAIVLKDGTERRLTTKILIDNHVASWEELTELEIKMLTYNFSFFQHGRASNFFAGLAQKLPAILSRMLTDLLAQSSPPEKQPSTN